LDITTIHRSGFLSAQIRITLNDLEWPIQSALYGRHVWRRFVAGFGFDLTHRCSQRGEGVDWRA